MDKTQIEQFRLVAAIRAGHQVQRFHTQPLVHRESVGEHTAGVLGVLLGMYYPKFPSPQLMARAVMHDIPEQWTGDAPAHAKWNSENLALALEEAEDEALRDNGIDMPAISGGERAALKFADSMDCLLKCMDELELGNRGMLRVVTRLLPYAHRVVEAVPEEQRGFCAVLLKNCEEVLGVSS